MSKTEDEKKEAKYKIPWGFLAGVAVGVATGLYLNSKSGKEKRQQLNEKISDWEVDLEAKLKNSFEEIKNDILSGKKETVAKTAEKQEKESSELKA